MSTLPTNPSKSFMRANPHIYGIPEKGAMTPIFEPPPKKRLSQSSKPLLNRLESTLFDYLLKENPGVLIHPQAITFRLANGVRLSPDFFAFDFPWIGETAGPTAIECKGKHAWEDSMIKLKFAAKEYQQVRWLLAWKVDGRWCFQRILP